MTSIFLNYLLKKVAKRPITLILVYKYLRNLSINSTMILFCLFISVVSKSGSVIQTKHFDIKMSLEIRQAKSFFLTLWVMFFASFHFFIFFILRITINCNYLFTKHFKYKTLIYLCQRPPPRKICCFLFVQEVGGRGNGYSLLQIFFGMRWYLHGWDIRYLRCFLDAAVSARVGYSISQMLF